jgi:hypothetical protein
MTDPRRPLHIGVFVGLSGGVYALSLAGVTVLQSRTEAAIAADRVPTADAISQLAAQGDSLEANARRARLAYSDAMGAYDRVGQALAEVEGRLGELAKTVQAVDGASRALPDRVALPRVNRTATTIRIPTVHATTSASGG